MPFIYPIENVDQRSVLVCAALFGTLTIFMVGLRILSRRIADRSLESSDWLIISACAVNTFFQGIVISTVLAGGLGFHVEEIGHRFGRDGPVVFLKILWALSLALAQISILVLCSKVFEVQRFMTMAKVTGVFICLWALASVLSAFLICRPFTYIWDHTKETGTCGNPGISWDVTGTLNVMTDLVVLLLPMPYLYALELELHNRLALMGTFGIGLLTCIISIFKVATIQNVDFEDVTATIPRTILFASLEPNVAISLACVPLLRPLIRGRAAQRRSIEKAAYVARRQRDTRVFDQLRDDSSTKHLRPDIQQYHVKVESRDCVGGPRGIADVGLEEEDFEMSNITVQKVWMVQRGKEDEVE
ncbi:hypothetical protein F5Y15DRAFT_412715 [Xylariaceae sp. FL0016]|nr:hypothetical protein F5Y15DRAFT_412715 [Xylariaceae sp. FL0016]